MIDLVVSNKSGVFRIPFYWANTDNDRRLKQVAAIENWSEIVMHLN